MAHLGYGQYRFWINPEELDRVMAGKSMREVSREWLAAQQAFLAGRLEDLPTWAAVSIDGRIEEVQEGLTLKAAHQRGRCK